MDSKQINAKYTFTMGGINFDVEIDDSLSAEYRAKKYPESNKKSLHYHPLHEVFFVFDEGISVVFEDGTKEFKNCILCIPPNTKHFTNRTSDYRLLFSCNANGPVKDGFSNFFKNIFTSSIFCVPAIKQDVKDFLRELFFHFNNPQTVVIDEVIVSFLKILFFHIYILNGAPFLRNEKYGKESRYIVISRLVNECTTPGNDVTLSTIAEELHLSEKQVSKIIFKYYGKPLSEVITEEKLEYALYLLSTTNTPITEIAYKCNFHSENYFYHLFKKKFGVTPLKYRKQKLEK